jgi:hypothetical protein
MIGSMQSQQKSARLLTVFCALAGLAPEAQAYLDPSTGSMILSAIVGLFATLGLAVKTYWYKFRNLLIRRPEAAPETQRDVTNRSAADSTQGNQPS